jgi:hypothetical protein
MGQVIAMTIDHRGYKTRRQNIIISSSLNNILAAFLSLIESSVDASKFFSTFNKN